MNAQYVITTIARFDRLARKLTQQHPEFARVYTEARQILGADPYNRSRAAQITKLVDSAPGEPEFRLRIRRWRFLYSISDQTVVLYQCGLRREDTY